MWFTDNPWPPMAIFVLLALLFFALWATRPRNSYLAAAIVMCAACVGTFFLEQWIVTDEELVESQIYEITDAFRRQDIDGTLDYFSANADDYREIVRRAGDFIGEVHTLRITDVDVKLLAAGSRARTHFRANGELTGNVAGKQRYTTRWLMTWQQEGGRWKVIKVERLDPLTGEAISLLSLHR